MSMGDGTSPSRTGVVEVARVAARGGGEQRGRVGMARRRKELPGRGDVDEPPEVHDRDPIGQVADDSEVVRDKTCAM